MTARDTPATPARKEPTPRWRMQVNRHPSAILLMAQLIGLLLYPFIEGKPWGSMLFGTFSVIVLCLAIAMVQRTTGHVLVSAALAIVATVLNIARVLSASPALLPWAAGIEALFYFHATGSLLVYMLADRRATTDELFAAGATFTLLAWGFTYVFVLLQALQPDAFLGIVDPGAARGWTELMFLSFALLSSTGIGDVIPIGLPARAVASLEMFVGVMYLTLVVSRLIGLTLQQRR